MHSFVSTNVTLMPTSKPARRRVPAWTPEQKAQPDELVNSIKARRGGKLLNLDEVLLWSEPVASGWNVFMNKVRNGLSVDRRWLELGICTVALLTGADYEYHHHAPDFLKAGGTQAELDALLRVVKLQPSAGVSDAALGEVERLLVQYAAQITQNIRVDDALFDALERHFDTTGLVELTMSISAYNMVARVLLATGVTPES